MAREMRESGQVVETVRRSGKFGAQLTRLAAAGFNSVRVPLHWKFFTTGTSLLFGGHPAVIGGITGDTLGANVQLCESAALIAFLAGHLR